jgi:hypothetical protein
MGEPVTLRMEEPGDQAGCPCMQSQPGWRQEEQCRGHIQPECAGLPCELDVVAQAA